MKGAVIECGFIAFYYSPFGIDVKLSYNVSLFVALNERVGIAGGSGSGKSTLLRLIALLDEPTSGNLWLFSKDVISIQNYTEIYRSIQMIFQNPLRDSTGDELRSISHRVVYQLWTHRYGGSKE